MYTHHTILRTLFAQILFGFLFAWMSGPAVDSHGSEGQTGGCMRTREVGWLSRVGGMGEAGMVERGDGNLGCDIVI